MSDTTSQISGAAPAAGGDVRPAAIALSVRTFGLLLATAMVCLVAPNLLNDPDTLWHIRIGQDIRATGAFPVADSYSHTFAGAPWIAKQWLSGVILSLAHDLGGWAGVVAVTIAAVIASFALVHGQLARHLAPLPALAIALWAFAMSSSVFVARPHMLALPFAIWFVIHVWNAADDRRAPKLLALGAMVLWANLHGSFTLGFLAAGAAFVHFAARDDLLARPGTWSLAALRHHRPLRGWIVFGALCPVAAMVHPYGWQAIASTFVMVDNAALAHIAEWQPLDFGADPLAAFSLIAIIVAFLATPLRAPLAKAAFVGLMLYMFVTHARFAPFFYLLTASLLAREIARCLPGMARRTWERRGDFDALQRLAGRRSRTVCTAMAALGVVLIASALTTDRLRPPGTVYPASAIAAARAAGLEGNVINSYDFGGALIRAGIPTFIDGRADRLFDNGAFIAETIAMAGKPEEIERLLDAHEIGWTLLKPADPNVAVMDGLDGWTRLHADADAVIHVRSPSGASTMQALEAREVSIQ
ncbi:MAG: hypothetical protein RIB53_18290 [Roseitalea porphyridii]|jgi:hypothetical protein|uniref:hypothetical protein n=1 Tax=Alphaproteobacteria TaxID=28211 RepID=UPI0032EB2E02